LVGYYLPSRKLHPGKNAVLVLLFVTFGGVLFGV
jgi:hypothetical protein